MEDLPRPWPEYDMPPALALPPDPAMDAANGPSPGAGPASLYGACSIETYRAAGALHAAHRDAGGFLDAVDRFAAPDFWRRDGAVKSWIYDRQPVQHAPGRDMDSVRVFYHAGHGRMGDDGVFHLPMGALWTGTDACLTSERMRLGTDALRYLFWSTSQGLRVGPGTNPLHSWARANHGLRMLFGFDSICWDSGRYGANFWRHWRMGKPFAQSWLDGAWDIAPDQSPVACACGPSPEAALAMLFSERRFRAERGSAQGWAWRWHAPAAVHQRAPTLTEPPAEFSAVRLVPVAQDRHLVQSVMSRLGLDAALAATDAQGAISLARGALRLQRDSEGRILLELGDSGPGRGLREIPPCRTLVGRARNALRQHGFLPAGTELVFDRVSLALSATASLSRLDQPPAENLDEIIVKFRQSIDGIPVLTPDAGGLRLAMRPDGTVLRIESTLRRVAERMPPRAHRHGLPDDPPPPRRPEGMPEPEPQAIPRILAQHSARLMRDLAARGAAPLNLRILPGTTEIGYGIRSNTARLVARQGIEIECARGFRKRYWIQSDLGD
ncbi:DUF6345 domain-containing protein [Paracoccus thiocyanatus]|uniref:Uncharacterized protein n=1 Tax=Paracoccus thiocyanatus TaxID=34006 RepID=A0A3D8PCN0_9RHOB|nr:DUF6345 domain-containing protein [Paracoccus thiocyanatus]RDW13836.1 hypothetical protein DIE28_05855 [Paracoccus thiocyanatus]